MSNENLTNMELLELAAKAAGYDVFEWTLDGDLKIKLPSGKEFLWNPLQDDGDALRLAVLLQLTITNEHINSGVAYCSSFDDMDEITYSQVSSGTDESYILDEDYAATRKAIVIAAVEKYKLGKINLV